jgi:hypothetical protein
LFSGLISTLQHISFSFNLLLVCFFSRELKGSSICEAVDEDEEILGSDDDEQEDPHDYTKGNFVWICNARRLMLTKARLFVIATRGVSSGENRRSVS